MSDMADAMADAMYAKSNPVEYRRVGWEARFRIRNDYRQKRMMWSLVHLSVTRSMGSFWIMLSLLGIGLELRLLPVRAPVEDGEVQWPDGWIHPFWKRDGLRLELGLESNAWTAALHPFLWLRPHVQWWSNGWTWHRAGPFTLEKRNA